jgi:uroporphyrinogen-III synthase
MRIFLFKAQKPNDEYKLLLENNHFEPCFMQVLNIEFTNQGQLKDLLNSHFDYSGLIFTSQNAVKAVANINFNMKEWHEKPCFVVGKATEREALKLNVNPSGSDTGNWKNLQEFIKENHKDERPLLFLIGDRVQAKITELNVKSLVVYNNKPIKLDVDLKDAFVVVFSPSGLETFEHRRDCMYISIGPTTKKAMDDLGIFSIQCETPCPKGVLNAINIYKQKMNILYIFVYYLARPNTSSDSSLALLL